MNAAKGWFSATGSVPVEDDEVIELAELLAGKQRGRFVELADGSYVALIKAQPAMVKILSLGEEVVVQVGDQVYHVLPEAVEEEAGKDG